MNQTADPCPILKVYLDVFYIYVYGIGPIVILGLVFNTITLLVLSQQKSKVNSIFLLKILAVSDMIFLLVCMVYFPIRHLHAYSTTGDMIFRRWDLDIGPWIFVATMPLYFAATQNRNWLIVIITVERFLNLVFPLWARGAITKRRLTYAVSLNTLIAMACNLYYYWLLPVLPHVNPCTGEDEMAIVVQPWGFLLDQWLYTVMTVFVPLVLLYIMNMTLIVTLRRTFQNRRAMTGGDSNKDEQAQRQATLMVVGITVVFFICETPASLDRFATIAGIQFSADDPFYNYGRKIGLLLVVLDSAVNFLSYCISNRPFRQGLTRLCAVKARIAKPVVPP